MFLDIILQALLLIILAIVVGIHYRAMMKNRELQEKVLAEVENNFRRQEKINRYVGEYTDAILPEVRKNYRRQEIINKEIVEHAKAGTLSQYKIPCPIEFGAKDEVLSWMLEGRNT